MTHSKEAKGMVGTTGGAHSMLRAGTAQPRAPTCLGDRPFRDMNLRSGFRIGKDDPGRLTGCRDAADKQNAGARQRDPARQWNSSRGNPE